MDWTGTEEQNFKLYCFFQQLKIANKEAIASLNKKFGSFHEALLSKEKSPPIKHERREEQPPVNVDKAAEELSRL